MEKAVSLHLVIPAEKVKLFGNLYNDIAGYMERNEPIPCDLIEGFTSCFFTKEYHDEIESWKKARRVTGEALRRMQSVRGYDFKWQTITIKTKDGIKEYKQYSENKLCECAFMYFSYLEGNPNCTKEDAIDLLYECVLHDHLIQPIKSHRKKITEYKRSVIAGILAIAVGYKLTSKKDPTNEEIYQAVRNALKKKKP